jgi:hypothetical protein
MTRDEEHLRLLSIFHYVVGGLAGLFALFCERLEMGSWKAVNRRLYEF